MFGITASIIYMIGVDACHLVNFCYALFRHQQCSSPRATQSTWLRHSLILPPAKPALTWAGNTTILSVGQLTIPIELALEIVRVLLTTDFAGGRHLNRVRQIEPS